MNANDLADRLEQFYTGTHIEKAAEVLRHQQAEIDALKDALRMKVILNEHAQQSMKEYKELLK